MTACISSKQTIHAVSVFALPVDMEKASKQAVPTLKLQVEPSGILHQRKFLLCWDSTKSFTFPTPCPWLLAGDWWGILWNCARLERRSAFFCKIEFLLELANCQRFKTAIFRTQLLRIEGTLLSLKQCLIFVQRSNFAAE